MCLVCGEVVCSQSYCCQAELDGEAVGACTAHAHTCGARVGIFLRYAHTCGARVGIFLRYLTGTTKR
jgi:hypothetical protein